MLWLPTLSLMVVTFVLVGALGLLIWSVAFRPSRSSAHFATQQWQATTTDRRHLRTWAADLAQRVVGRLARLPRSAETPLAIASEVEAGINVALEHVGGTTKAAPTKSCPDATPHRIPVTVPEALIIADELRRMCPPAELHAVRELAEVNAKRVRLAAGNGAADAGVPCPLRTAAGYCMTFANRPIACRQLCPNCIGIGVDGDSMQSSAARDLVQLTTELHIGTTSGLTSGLRRAGLDAQTYELNDALATALRATDAAERWIHGEPVFSQCLKV